MKFRFLAFGPRVGCEGRNWQERPSEIRAFGPKCFDPSCVTVIIIETEIDRTYSVSITPFRSLSNRRPAAVFPTMYWAFVSAPGYGPSPSSIEPTAAVATTLNANQRQHRAPAIAEPILALNRGFYSGFCRRAKLPPVGPDDGLRWFFRALAP